MASDSAAKKIVNSFKDPEQLKMLCESQYMEIVDLSKKLKKQDEKIKQLNEELKIHREKPPELNVNDEKYDINLDEEVDYKLICTLQLEILKNRSLNQELTLEEARKVEIYSKILTGGSDKSNNSQRKLKQVRNEDLIKQLEEKN